MKISVENDRGRLRLRWLYQGKRINLSLGVDDSPVGRAFAKQKAAQIELDMAAGHYDATLLRYKPRTLGKAKTELSAVELFSTYTAAMAREKVLSRNGLQKYKALSNHLHRGLGHCLAVDVSDRRARDFAANLLEHMASGTAKQYLFLLSACWQWAAGKYHISENPWRGCMVKLKPHESKRVKPFTHVEIKAILAGFESSQPYKHYYPVVRFLFLTAVRPGEAFGLRWRSVADDFSHVVIREAVSRGERRACTKTGKSRIVYLSAAGSELLRGLAATVRPGADQLVFPSVRGRMLDDHNFCQRAWRRVLTAVGVAYRSPYAIRHTAISHALAAGVNPVELSEQTGHDKAVMLSTYAHAIQQKSLFVEF